MDVPATSVATDESQKNDYSVWAAPPVDVIPRIKKLMEGLRSEFGGPQLEPHMTVVGLVSLTKDDALAKFKAACDGLKTYNCSVDSWATGLYVVEASAKSSSTFGFKSSTPYMPHISLLYGDLTDEEKKKAQEKAYFLDESIDQLSFPITRLQLWKTPASDNTLTSWEKIAEYNLSPN
ncbi:cyclic phosphodiesterase-like [Pistacia vera]|uniref:cyclic phosphodiesterase-like n=1 Tax=Pistacia vera TaxID=55513 RepID=UPI001262AF5D|nr:cyclic phosphodiesterase-like [Pistacia vera]